ncbi:hypothetical protein B6N60_00575 [Richelia sinica FACHB-800]|uniref:PBP domain-containing protein n=1 Tax=Richelia sinica FACHB-800 TaxID=1357546 RepID=A0A975Y3B1_9NOST|nr:phosphate ABC transporter substrate-binding protein [Richelia sinica]MBD2663041.1 phosphate ABC transporter substrate-binding protein [Richelia sinica FACHB-800]QXE21897.1 hypothetical protein B6N60_00575 [Richelia sinica FACHB-800]
MSQKSGPPPIVYILIFLALLGGGYWLFFTGSVVTIPPLPSNTTQPNNEANNTNNQSFPLPNSVPSGTTIRIDGSTSMVTINQNFKRGFEAKFIGTKVEALANGTSKGIADVLAGKVDLAGASRPLTAQEKSQGLTAVPITTDKIAVVIGKDNSFTKGLTSSQVADIFQGKITDWSQVGGKSGSIRVINRPEISGTHQSFREMVLKGATFGTGTNFTNLSQDATTPLLQALKTDGVGYATFSQVTNQQTVRVVAIDGLTPDAASYPYQRQLYYVYKNPASSGVQAFLGYAASPQGQQNLAVGN